MIHSSRFLGANLFIEATDANTVLGVGMHTPGGSSGDHQGDGNLNVNGSQFPVTSRMGILIGLQSQDQVQNQVVIQVQMIV